MEITFSKCAKNVAILGTSAEVLPNPLHFKNVVLPADKLIPLAITEFKRSVSIPRRCVSDL
jgi:hypothetical protein